MIFLNNVFVYRKTFSGRGVIIIVKDDGMGAELYSGLRAGTIHKYNIIINYINLFLQIE